MFYGSKLQTECSYDYRKKRFPDHDPKITTCSGDATLPEFSATYPVKYWSQIKATEIENTDHSAILRHAKVINQILEYAIEKPAFDLKLFFEAIIKK